MRIPNLSDELIEYIAAEIWRAEHPDDSVFACTAEMKEHYRGLVRSAIAKLKLKMENQP